MIRLSATRAQRLAGETDVRASFLGLKRVTVSGAEFSATLVPDYSELVADPDFWMIELLDDDITVCAQVETGVDSDGNQRQRDASARAIFGDYGEAFASSPHVYVFGSLANWIEVQTVVSLSGETVLRDINAAQSPKQARLADLVGFCL